MDQKIDFSENRNVFMPSEKMKKSLLQAVKKYLNIQITKIRK